MEHKAERLEKTSADEVKDSFVGGHIVRPRKTLRQLEVQQSALPYGAGLDGATLTGVDRAFTVALLPSAIESTKT